MGSALLVVTAAAACAQPGGRGATAGTGAPTPAGTVVVTPTQPLPSQSSPVGESPDAVDASGCHSSLRLTESNSGQAYCLSRGGMVTVTLHGVAGQLWQPVTLSGSALEPAHGTGVPEPATVVDTYLAVRAGTAKLASSRSLCPPPTPGDAACMGMQAFLVSIRVP